jgi:hypothetical protein
MRLARFSRSLLIACLIAGHAAAGDDAPTGKAVTASALAPRPRASHNTYGAPIQAPIVGRKASSKKKASAKAPFTGKTQPSTGKTQRPRPKTQRSELDEPF